MKRPAVTLFGAGALLVVAVYCLQPSAEPPREPVSGPRSSGTPEPTTSDRVSPTISTSEPAAPRASSAPRPHSTVPLAEMSLGERELMTELRRLLATDPARVIALARAKNQQLPDSPEAAERAWMIVKSLDGLARHHEARAAALDIVSRYPDTPWARDVQRHVLVYPLDQPSREEMQAGAEPRVEVPAPRP